MTQQPVTASVDGSEKAARAIAVAGAIAKLADADLNVMRVIDTPSERLLAHAEAIGLDDAVVSGRGEAETQLADAVAGVTVGPGRRVTFEVLGGSDAAAAIVGAVREVFPDVIAMSTRGTSGLGRLILGSVAEGVIRSSELSVLLLTPRMLAQ